MSSPFDLFWSEILSREAERVQAAFSLLSKDEQKNVISHLKQMVADAGWHKEQVASARAALEALNDE